MDLGKLLKQARLDAGLSQRQLCGEEITRNMLSQIENGTARPSMKTLQYLSSRLGRPMSFFLQETEGTPLEGARKAFRQGRFADALALEAEGDEGELIRTLCCLALAEAAISDQRLPYARQLLEDAAAFGAKTLYYTPELERRRQLLLARGFPQTVSQVVESLPDEELLLRAEKALTENAPQRAAALLDAAGDKQTERWNILRGDAAFFQGNHSEAKGYYLHAEEKCLAKLEECCKQLEDFKGAYEYAIRQRGQK